MGDGGDSGGGDGNMVRTFVEFLEVFELGREAAFTCCVHDEDDFAFEICEWVFVALLVFRLEVVEGRRGSHGC